ncbi:MAG TPA: sulfatase-like hydrolase/transferase [Microvirga sp.]|jgi:hypothetical protein
MRPLDGKSSPLADALRTFALCSFAVAQPLFDLLGRNEEFFVAHRIGAAGIVLFALAVTLGPAVLLIGLQLAVHRLAPRVQAVLHLVIVFGLLALIAAPILNRAARLPNGLAFIAMVSAAALLTWLYAARTEIRRFVSALALGGLVFPLLFLLVSPVSSLVLPQGTAGLLAGGGQPATLRNPAPIVFIVFDEFETGALLDETGEIDPVRYPNFAALAKESSWFPRATTVWAETKKAVPAILTGMRPSAANQLTYKSHPNNLFTWLQRDYRFHVDEAVTALCPPVVCGEAAQTPFRSKVFLSDLGVVYLHIVLPPAIAAKRLPSMDTAWAGFAAANLDADLLKAFTSTVQTTAYGDRRGQFLSFMRGIEGGNTLNFLHMLLPHNPQVYLPKRASYLGWGIEGLTNSVWSSDPYMAALGYQRYMLQLGQVDTLLGELVGRMKSMGIYDSALIVVTADHGRSFIPGLRTRSTTPTSAHQASEMFKVPLFIKRPGQKEGQRSERHVHTIDIIPTLADVLGAELPWKADGVSVFAPNFPERKTLQVGAIDGVAKPQEFDLAELTKTPRLPWKLATFGARTPLDQLAVSGPYATYIGRSTADLPLMSDGPELSASLAQADLFADVDPASGIVPALVRGEIGGNPTERPLHVAVGFNGRVAAVVPTSAWAGKPHYFAAMLPESQFRAGRNQIELFQVATRDGSDVFTPIAIPDQDPLRIDRTETGEALVSQKGKVMPIRDDAVLGSAEFGLARIGLFNLAGWAADRQALSPSTKIVVFADGRQIHVGGTGVSRPALVDTYKAPDLATAGFSFNIQSQVIRDGARLRAFAIARDGTAGEIAITNRANAAREAAAP